MSFEIESEMQNPLLVDYVPILIFLVVAAAITGLMIFGSDEQSRLKRPAPDRQFRVITKPTGDLDIVFLRTPLRC